MKNDFVEVLWKKFFVKWVWDIFSLPIYSADCCVGVHLFDHHFQLASSSDPKNHHMISFQVFYFHKKIFGTDRVLKDIIYKWSIIFIINVWCPKSVAKKKCVHSNWVQHILYVSNSIYRSMVIFTRFVLWELRIFLMENF